MSNPFDWPLFVVFLANDGETYLVSTLTPPQHPVCSCGPSKTYAERICRTLNDAAKRHSNAIDPHAPKPSWDTGCQA